MHFSLNGLHATFNGFRGPSRSIPADSGASRHQGLKEHSCMSLAGNAHVREKDHLRSDMLADLGVGWHAATANSP